ncbi:MAG: polynucleotide adenylyltransferase [Treponema sp.]|nr:MAG: polynucleotide adenylyltransferase [Treponema sp.]
MKKFNVPYKLKEVASIFHGAGFQVFLVGGAVRDFFLGKKPPDYDLASDAKPEDVMRIFKKVLPTGIAHGTVTILYKGLNIECTTFRADGDYSDARHPDNVNYVASIEEDLSRRDFTVNAMAVSLPKGNIVDPFNGASDLKKCIIQTVGNPDKRFSEDALRLMRAVRFATKLNFQIEEKTFDAISKLHENIKSVSIERVRDEFSKILLSEKPIIGLRLLESTGLLKIIIPELSECRGVEQKGMHRFDVLDHSFLVCNQTPPELHLRLSGLFHDIAKPQTRAQDSYGNFTFYRHEVKGAKLTGKILKRLKFPNRLIDKVVLLIREHMFHYEENWKSSTVRRFIARVGRENIDDLFALRQADTFGLQGEPVPPILLSEFAERIDTVLSESNVLGLKDLTVNGNDLIKIGVPKGKMVGRILYDLLQTVLDDPAQNNRKQLLEIAGKLKEKYRCN